jgi:hypothetical protein
VVVKLVKRDMPDMEEFKKKKEELATDFALVKSYRLLDDWTSSRCRVTRDRGDISITQSYIDYGDVDEKTGQPRRTAYEPCAEPLSIPGLPPGFTFSQ